MKDVSIFDSSLKTKILRNYKLPVFILSLIIVIFTLVKLYNIIVLKAGSIKIDYLVIAFCLVFILCAAFVIRNFFDFISVSFGQKGQDALTKVAKK